VVSKEGYKDRRLKLEGLPKINGVKIVESLVANSIDDVKKAHAKYTKQGFEGTMIRNKLGAYKSGRSANLQKFKDFMDDEFKIVDFTEGEGHDKGCVVWECETKDKQTFKVRPRGDVSQRKAWFKEGAKNNGKKLNVRFQEYSTAGVPRFPVGTGIRDYE
jgi:DNA ligase-1